jgi:hypothetical protein
MNWLYLATTIVLSSALLSIVAAAPPAIAAIFRLEFTPFPGSSTVIGSGELTFDNSSLSGVGSEVAGLDSLSDAQFGFSTSTPSLTLTDADLIGQPFFSFKDGELVGLQFGGSRAVEQNAQITEIIGGIKYRARDTTRTSLSANGTNYQGEYVSTRVYLPLDSSQPPLPVPGQPPQPFFGSIEIETIEPVTPVSVPEGNSIAALSVVWLAMLFKRT